MLLRTTDPFRDFDRLASQVLGTTNRPAVMPMDAWREGDVFLIEFDLPGVSPGVDRPRRRAQRAHRARRAARPQRRLGDARLRASARRLQPAAGPRRQPRPRPDRGPLRRRRAAAEHPGRRAGQAAQDRGEHQLERPSGPRSRPDRASARPGARRHHACRGRWGVPSAGAGARGQPQQRSATRSASSRIAMPSRISSADVVHGGTTCSRLKWTNGHSPRCLAGRR